MSILILLIGISVTVAGIFLGAYLWAVKSGQFEDDYTPAIRVLFDDKSLDKKETTKPNQHTNGN